MVEAEFFTDQMPLMSTMQSQHNYVKQKKIIWESAQTILYNKKVTRNTAIQAM